MYFSSYFKWYDFLIEFIFKETYWTFECIYANWQQQINKKSLKPCYELSQVQYQNDRNTTVCQKIVRAKCVSANRLKIQTCTVKFLNKNLFHRKNLLKTVITTSCSIIKFLCNKQKNWRFHFYRTFYGSFTICNNN